MSFYPSKILTVSKIRSLWYPERAMRRAIRLPGGGTWMAGQIFYELTAAANEVQTLTFGGTITGGSISLLFQSQTGYDLVGPIAYNATAATMRANIQAALDNYFGPSQAVVTASGPYTITYSGNLVANSDIPLPTVVNNLTGTSPTIAAATTTAGSGGLNYFEPYAAGSSSGTNYVILEENTRTAADGTILDEHGSTGNQQASALCSGAFLLSQLTGADTVLFPSDGTWGRMGKFASGQWNTYPASYPGSVVLLPGF